MPITTKSKEALALYLEARTKGDNWHREEAHRLYAQAVAAFVLLTRGKYAEADRQFAKANVEEPFFVYYAAVAKEKAGDAAAAKRLYARVADWNEDTLWYAFVRNKAKAKVR
jgi:hypothetical protein